jgi:hypothetical protein
MRERVTERQVEVNGPGEGTLATLPGIDEDLPGVA